MNPKNKPGYLVTVNGKVQFLPLKEFKKKFQKPGPNFQSRLEQIRKIIPGATDWEMLSGDSGI